jgi:hypothetical protein
MPTSKGPYCPEWCEEVHPQNGSEDEFTIHWKSFGIHPDNHLGLVRVWVAFEGEKKYSSGAEVSTLETYWADDIRSLASDCIEAAEWMEENLQTIQDSKSTI